MRSPDDFRPYRSRTDFKTAEFLFSREQMSAGNINILLDLWAETLSKHDDIPPFADANDLYNAIDSTESGDITWESFDVSWNRDMPEQDIPAWMTAKYDVWFRSLRAVIHNMLRNPEFDGGIDYAPLREFDGENRRLTNLMSGDWAWKQAVSRDSDSFQYILIYGLQDIIAGDPNTHGAAFVPVVLGSDKTTVSVATGQNEYYPLYLSIGNIHNSIRRAHRNGVVLIAFLAIPKSK